MPRESRASPDRLHVVSHLRFRLLECHVVPRSGVILGESKVFGLRRNFLVRIFVSMRRK
jgi:hypothetical protein